MKENSPRRIRADAKLRDLSEDQRKQVLHWFAQCGWASCLVRVRTELGIETNRDSLYKAIKRWENEEANSVYLSIARSQAEMEAESKGGMTLEEIEEAVDRNFIVLASQTKDLKEYKDLRYLQVTARSARQRAQLEKVKLDLKKLQIEQKDRDFALQREKFVTESCEKIMKAARDPKVREIVESEKTNAEKIAEIRQLYFADIDAVKVELPE
jgi:hypothetical protein